MSRGYRNRHEKRFYNADSWHRPSSVIAPSRRNAIYVKCQRELSTKSKSITRGITAGSSSSEMTVQHCDEIRKLAQAPVLLQLGTGPQVSYLAENDSRSKTSWYTRLRRLCAPKATRLVVERQNVHSNYRCFLISMS